MNRKLITVIWILWCVAGSCLTATSTKKTVVLLPEVVKPIAFLSDDTQFYVVEQAAVNIYRWDGFRFIKKIGGRGEGPQEYNVSGSKKIRISVHHDQLVVYTPTKCLEYQKNGSYIKEYRVRDEKGEGYSGWFYKLGKHYLLSDLAPGETLMKFVSYYLGDSKLNKIRELCRYRLSTDIYEEIFYIFPQFFSPVFYKEMGFVTADENLGIIGVNANGKTFLNLKYNHEKIRVTENHIAAYHQYYKTEHPNRSRYERQKSRFRFPEYFPPIKNFKVANDQIYVQTWKQNEQMESQFLIFNLKGTYLRTVYLPVEPDNIETDYPYLFHNGRFVQLIENIDDEAWELHITPID